MSPTEGISNNWPNRRLNLQQQAVAPEQSRGKLSRQQPDDANKLGLQAKVTADGVDTKVGSIFADKGVLLTTRQEQHVNYDSSPDGGPRKKIPRV